MAKRRTGTTKAQRRPLSLNTSSLPSVPNVELTCDQDQKVFLPHMHDLSPRDKPLPEGSTYRIVLDLEAKTAEGKLKGHSSHSGLNQLGERP